MDATLGSEPKKLVIIDYDGKKCYVLIEGEFTYKNFKNQVRSDLNIEGDFEVFDDKDIKINEKAFPFVKVEFYIIKSQIIATPIPTGTSTEHTSISHPLVELKQELRDFFVNQKELLLDSAKLLETGLKSKNDIDKIMLTAVTHLLKKYPHPVKEVKVQYAQALLMLFPSLEIETQLRYDGVYNPKNQGGLLGCMLKKIQNQRRKEKNDTTVGASFTNTTENDKNSDENGIKKKEIIANKERKRKISQKMDETLTDRRKMIKRSSGMNILEKFPELFNRPGLIQDDFKKLYPECNVDLTNYFSDEFLQKLRNNGKQKIIKQSEKEWPTPIYETFLWLTLLPPTGNGRAESTRHKLCTAFQQLIIFVSENETIPVIKCTKIVAQGTSKQNISNYYVATDQGLICTRNTFLDALDILFKVHFVLDIEYDITMRNFFEYLERFVYKIIVQGTASTLINKCRILLK